MTYEEMCAIPKVQEKLQSLWVPKVGDRTDGGLIVGGFAGKAEMANGSRVNVHEVSTFYLLRPRLDQLRDMKPGGVLWRPFGSEIVRDGQKLWCVLLETPVGNGKYFHHPHHETAVLLALCHAWGIPVEVTG